MSVYDLPPGLAPGPPGPPDMGPPGLGGGLPPQLAGAGAPPDQGAPADPLGSVQDAIHAVVAAMHALPGPQDTQDAAQALLVLARIQTRLQGPQGAGPQG